MRLKRGRFIAAALAILLLSFPGVSQDKEKKRKAASLDGTTGLFKTWDAETLRSGEINFSVGWSHYNRDPGELSIKTLPVGLSYGLHDRFEVFGSFDAVKRIRGRGIPVYRVIPGNLPIPSWTPLGSASFTNEAPFIDVPVATGLGDVRLGAKFNLFSERRGDALAVSVAGFAKIPTANSSSALNRGLGTGEVDGGFGALFSKTTGHFGKLHLNTLLNFTGNPEMQGIVLADLQHEFIYRAGAEIPAYNAVQLIAEVEGKTYFGSRTLGLNPRSPVDLIFGIRIYPKAWLSLGAGYRASLNHIKEEPVRRVFPAGTNGFVAQVTLGKRANDPPTVTCAVSNSTIKQDETTTVRANAVDPDGDTLTYSWTTTGGKVTGTADTATFDATGVAPGKYTVTCTVSDGKHQVTCSAEITVLKKNLAPTVTCSPSSTTVTQGETATIRATASDPNNDALTYSWTVNGQKVAADGPAFTFGTEGRAPGAYTITATVSDGELSATCTSTVTVQAKANRPPVIECLTTSVDVASGGTVELRVRASDPDGDRTTITWSATGGSVTGTGETAIFNAAGLRAGSYTVTATVDDGRGGRASCNMTVNVSERIIAAEGFRPTRWRVDNVAKAVLDDITVRMQNDRRLRANIVGYTDGSRQEKSRKDLGRRRAQSAADYLKKKGIDPSRLTVTDGGDTHPIGDNKTAAGRKKNRRVEIELTVR